MEQEKFLDIIGQVLWYSMLGTPFIAFPIIWKNSRQTKWVKLLLGIGLALAFSVILGVFSFLIMMRKGLGPT